MTEFINLIEFNISLSLNITRIYFYNIFEFFNYLFHYLLLEYNLFSHLYLYLH